MGLPSDVTTTPPPAPDPGVCGLDPAKFDALIGNYGMQVAYRSATRCACYRFPSGQPDPGCTICFALGLVWGDPESIMVYGPNRKPTRRVDLPGQYEIGDVFFTFQSGFLPNEGARITLPNSPLIVDDILTCGKEDRIIYSTAFNLSAAWYVVRDPPTGDPYVNVRVDLTPDVDVFLDPDTKRVTYADPSNPPVGTRVLIQVNTLTEYIVSEVQDRYSGSALMPYRALCKRYDYYLHPRGNQAVRY
jgi:hypothetical protein